MVTPNPVSATSSPQAPPSPASRPDANRALWVAFIVLGAVLIGAAGGVLAWLGGLVVAHAILAGAGGCATAITVGLLLYGALSSR